MNKLDYPRRNGTHKVRITSKSAGKSIVNKTC